MPSRNRVPATIQMVRGMDDDLIDWYTSLPEKERHKILKNKLRASLGLPTHPTEPQNAVNAGFEFEQIEGFLQQFDQDWNQRIQQLVDSLPDYVQRYVEQALNGHSRQSEDISGAPSLSSIELGEREARLKKAKW